MFRSRQRHKGLVIALAGIALAGFASVAAAQEPADPPPVDDTTGPCASVQLGTDAPDTLTGTAAGDLLKGVGRGDRLQGLTGADCLVAGDGRDVVSGGGGQDQLIGGRARDVMLARDGTRDVVRCGPGKDIARLDFRDHPKHCERVGRDVPDDDPPDDPPPDNPPPDDPPPDDPPPDDGAFTVPASVPSGCSTDATSQILSWIATVPDNSTIRFGSGDCYRIEGTLELRNRRLAIDGNGATFKSLNAPNDQRALWRAWDSVVSFRDMTIVGSYANGGTYAEQLQHAHAIDFRGTDGVVEDVSMSDLAGDCVYFGLGADRSSGAVRDSSCRRISRNGVSVTAGDDIRVERVTTDRIGYIAFDVEPNTGPGWGSSRVTFDSNRIGSYYMKAYTIIGNAPISDQAFTNNRVVGQGLKIGVVDGASRPQDLRISGNTSDTPAAPASMNLDGVNGLTVTGNTVPLTSGTMAQVDRSCSVTVSGNSYPGGSREASVTRPRC